MNALLTRLNEAVPNNRLIVFRILFGLVMAAECWGAIFTGLVADIYIDTPFNFTFIGCEWLRVLHGSWMYGYFGIMGAAALAVALGFRYRFSALLLALMWTASYYAEKTHYNNHYYLMLLLVWIMSVMPADRRASLDARRRPEIRSSWCRRWEILLFVLMIWTVYTFAAVAKLNADWLQAMPMRLWMGSKTDTPLVGPLLAHPVAPWFISYVGLLFDLLIVPLFLYRRTRYIALGLSLVFHLGNSLIFQIGTFPYLALALDLFFFAPKVFEKWLPRYDDALVRPVPAATGFRLRIAIAFVVWQCLLPLRHWLYRGDVAWNEEGHRMSWRMMLRSKNGQISFRVQDTTGATYVESPYTHLHADQARDVATQPDICWQFVQFLKAHYRKKGLDNIRVFADGSVSLNGGPYAPMFRPDVDLAKEDWHPYRHHHWITERPLSNAAQPE